MSLREIICRGGRGNVDIADDMTHLPAADVRTWVMIVNKQWVRVFNCGDSGLELVTELIRLYSGAMGNPLCFSNGVTGWLEEAAKNDAFDRLILVAPLHMISDMRSTFSVRILDRVVTDLGGVSTGIRLV